MKSQLYIDIMEGFKEIGEMISNQCVVDLAEHYLNESE